jgi:hypothetical protein
MKPEVTLWECRMRGLTYHIYKKGCVILSQFCDLQIHYFFYFSSHGFF